MADHAVLVQISSLLDAQDGLDTIEDPLIEAIEAAGVGEFDGNEIGDNGATLYMYGPDADALWHVIEPVLRSARLGPGAFVIKRYGSPGAEEIRVQIT